MVTLTTVDVAVSHVQDAAMVGIGGMLLARRPISLVRGLVRRGVRGLTIVSLTSSLEIDELFAAGSIAELRSCFASHGIFGLSDAVSDPQGLRVRPETEMSIVQGLGAAAAGLGFLPMRAWDDTDFPEVRPDVASVTCPYTGETYRAFPAITPDVALLHVAYADTSGNCRFGSDPGVDVELARASRLTIVSTEEIISTAELQAQGPVDLVGFEVDILVEAKGAPFAVPPHRDVEMSDV